MAANNKNQDGFDRMLAGALRGHKEAVPDDFTPRMMKQLQEVEAKRVLARVVLQERLALLGSIVPVCLVVIGGLFFPDRIAGAVRSLGSSLSGYGGGLADRIPHILGVIGNEWQFYSVLAVVLLFTVYCLLDLLVGDRFRVL